MGKQIRILLFTRKIKIQNIFKPQKHTKTSHYIRCETNSTHQTNENIRTTFWWKTRVELHIKNVKENKKKRLNIKKTQIGVPILKHILVQIECSQTEEDWNKCNIPKFLRQSLGQDETTIRNTLTFIQVRNYENIVYFFFFFI